MECIIQPVLGRVGAHVDCHKNFQNDVDDLRKRVAHLKRRRNDKVQELRMVDDSKKQVKEEVSGWLEDARRVIEIEMLNIEEEVQNVSYLSRGNLGRRIRQKIQEVREIYDRGSFLEGLVIERPPPIGITLPIEKIVGEVGVKKKIWEYLNSHEIGMIGVCGIGGVGKTTIMKHIHNELQNEATGFEKVIWVTVSQSLNIAKLQGDIARNANINLPESHDELERASELVKTMKTWKYALILDDVWDKFTLQRVGIPEPTMENGCKIVITSRSIDVCNYLRCQIVKVPPLPQKESFNLFLDTVGKDILRIPNLGKILKLMVAECAGLPLAIVVIAGSMRGVIDIREWRSALRQLCHCVVGTEKDSEDEIFKRLKFSYDRLPNSSIQECFLYCSLYPEDWKFRREDLIENWIYEGLIEKLGSKREMHDRGHDILNRLENNCLLEKDYRHDEEECVKMHDVVRDMALRVKSTGPGRFMVKAQMRLTKIPDEDEWTEDLDKVSLMKNEISYIPINILPKCLVLSTLILEGNYGLRQIPECFLANMPLLKFLNLSYTGIETLPNSICNLKNLTALILRGCEHLERMPSLSKLKALKKLDLDQAGLVVAPEGIDMLENLEHLDLSCLNLKILTQLQTYVLKGCRGIECVVSSSSSSSSSSSFTVMNNLEDLSPRDLRSLRDVTKVEETSASLAPTISPHIFCNLKELHVVECPHLNKLFPCELLQSQGLQNLEEIHVKGCYKMEELIGWEEEEEEGNQTTTTAIFTLPKLRRLYLSVLPHLKRICPERVVMVCDSLNSIFIQHCEEVKRIPRQPSLPAIKAIYIENGRNWWESVEWENPDDKKVLLPFLKYVSGGFWVRIKRGSV